MFENEQLLVNEIVSALEFGRFKLPRKAKQSNMKVLREVNLGYGIADLVIALYKNIDSSRKVFLNSTQIKILRIVEENPGIAIKAIINKTGASGKVISASLSVLSNENLICVRDGEITSQGKYVSSLTNSIAIEAKLKDWRRALKQAYRYKWFSERSYVCLPSTNIKPATSNLDFFKQMQVGLVSVCKDSGINILYDPKPAKPICKEMNLLLNECLLNTIYTF
jgi:DNA-binding MarR family transcriptional regulator